MVDISLVIVYTIDRNLDDFKRTLHNVGQKTLYYDSNMFHNVQQKTLYHDTRTLHNVGQKTLKALFYIGLLYWKIYNE